MSSLGRVAGWREWRMCVFRGVQVVDRPIFNFDASIVQLISSTVSTMEAFTAAYNAGQRTIAVDLDDVLR
jgi:hypothetical protein